VEAEGGVEWEEAADQVWVEVVGAEAREIPPKRITPRLNMNLKLS
jgi:hypothetical protein